MSEGRPTGIFYDPVFLQHETGPHPESPQRLEWIVRHLEESGLWGRCAHAAGRDASFDDLCLVHTAAHVERVKEIADAGGGMFDPDTVASAGSYDAAVRAAGAGLAAVEGVLEGDIRNALCLVRPPGHHALPDRAMGFCLFNNVAVAARHLCRRLEVERVAIFDWDGHHGNGTQEAFYRDPAVFYASLHASPHYPLTGDERENGEGPGLGTTVNRPLPRSVGAERFLAVAREVIEGPMAEFRPSFILISAGFDAYAEDSLASMGLEPESYGDMTELLMRLADACCGGRVASFLEGGYHQIGLPVCVAAHLRALMDEGARQ